MNDRFEQYEGREVIDSTGQKIGTIRDVLIDPDTDAVQWGVVHTGLFGSKKSYVPLVASEWVDDKLRIPYTKQQWKDAPHFDTDGEELSQAEEQQLASFYGLTYSQQQSRTGLVQPPTGGALAGTGASGSSGAGEDAMTRSEEQLRVGTIRRPAETVRLVKRVESEQVSEHVPIQREEIRVEREPITETNRDRALTGDAIRENVHEVTAMREEPVVEKTVEPKERVRLTKDVTEDEQEVTGEVRKERIEVERGASNR